MSAYIKLPGEVVMTRRLQVTSAVWLGTLILAVMAGSVDAKGKLGGKIFFTRERPRDVSAAALEREFEKLPPKAEVRREKAGHWVVTLVAFFRKPSAQGPITVWLYDKTDKQAIKDKEPIHQFSVDATSKEVFVHELDLDPDTGFNKEKSYLVMVGQLISKKEKIYATGEIKLLK
jgi:hypothetical protein